MAFVLPAGNAVRLVFSVPSAAQELRVLRRDDGLPPESLDDPVAVPVYGGDPVRSFVDWEAVPSGVDLVYRAWWRVAGQWTDGGAKKVRADPYFIDRSIEPLLVVRDRVDLGLRAVVERGQIHPRSGSIPVLIASPLIDDVPMPVVTVHLESESPEATPIGSTLSEIGDEPAFGHLSRFSIKVIGWSLNVDERLVLRRALLSILMANRDVFEEAGMTELDVSFADMEDFMSYSAPVYQAVGTVSCVAVREFIAPVPRVASVLVPIP